MRTSLGPKPFQILPWNGYPAAISLTFDDGDPTQLNFAIPEMTKRGIRGTFYLIGNRLNEINGWKEAFISGQELGNHSLDHKHAQDLTPQETIDQISQSKRLLENTFGVPIPTFAYPFTEITPALRKTAQEHHFLSRGGYGEVYFHVSQQPDWDYLPSQVIYAHTSSGILKGWTDANIYNKTWSIPQFHAFSGSTRGWQPLPPFTFTDFLDDLVARKNEIWIAPIGEVGAYWTAQAIVENTISQTSGSRTTWQWKKTALLPSGIYLKTSCAKNGFFQNEKELTRDKDGHLLIDFDQENLTFVTA